MIDMQGDAKKLLNDPNYRVVNLIVGMFGDDVQITLKREQTPERRRLIRQQRVVRLQEELNRARRELEELP